MQRRNSREEKVENEGTLWVFAYGSLIWDPGFAFIDRQVALLLGYHRAMCLYSTVCRGTPEKPGLVLGLVSSGSCHGIAYQVASADCDKTIAYLENRETSTGLYAPRRLPVTLHNGSLVEAYTFIANRAADQFAGMLHTKEALPLILQGRGIKGSSLEYLSNVVRQLAKFGIVDHKQKKLYNMAMQSIHPDGTPKDAALLVHETEQS